MNLLKKFGALSLSAILLMGLASCGSSQKPAETKKAETTKTEPAKPVAEKKDEKKPAAENKDLSEWNGEWNSIGVYLEKPELQEAFAELAKKEKVSQEEAKKAYLEKRACEFNGLRIQGNKVEFLDKGANEGGKPIATTEYEFVKSAKTKHGSHELTWYGFKAKDAGAKYPAMIMMSIHGEEALTHFHMRYGKDIDELLTMEKKWFPTFCHTDSTLDQVKAEVAE